MINKRKYIILWLAALALLATACTGPVEVSATEESFTPTPEITPLPSVDDPIPLIDLLDVSYHGLEGGLYPERSNTPPDEHAAEGLARAAAIRPLDSSGAPSPGGKIVLLSIGHNNAGTMFCGTGTVCSPGSFADLAARSVGINSNVVLINGASLGGGADTWAEPNSQKYRIIRERLLQSANVTAQQVQVVWLDVANAVDSSTPSLNANGADAYRLLAELGNIVRILKQQYPNLQQVFLSSRVYGGFGTGGEKYEPYAYETGFAVKWLIQEQILQTSGGSSSLTGITGDVKIGDAVPWLAWGPYLWANGSEPRSDGFSWQQTDFDTSGLNLTNSARAKTGSILLDFFGKSPFTYPWFVSGGVPAAFMTPEPIELTPTATAQATIVGTETPIQEETPTQAPLPTSAPGSGVAVCLPRDPDYPGSTATEPIPLIDMTNPPTANYYGFAGGLYPEISNVMPLEHAQEGLARAQNIQPLDVNGEPAADGKIIVLSVGMSNTSQEYCGKAEGCFANTFGGQANADPEVDTDHVLFINGARSGQSAEEWLTLDSRNFIDIRQGLIESGLSTLQVQVIWLKVVNGTAASRPSLPDPEADAYLLLNRLGVILRNLYILYPNLQQVFIASRTYGGYTSNVNSPEPYAYETGFAVKWLVEAQIKQMATGEVDPCTLDIGYDSAAPWVGWAAYMWANGTSPRSDGLTWERGNFQGDGVHMSGSGITKVGAMLLDFFKNSPLTQCWLVRDGACGLP